MNQRRLLFLFPLLTVLSANFVKVAIVGTNDLHGFAFPTQLFRSDLGQKYAYGGLQYMASMIDTIRNEYKGNFLYLDAGDQFQGGIQSGPLVSSGEIMNDYLNTVGADSSAIGNHEFDFGSSFLFAYLNGRKDGSFNLAANLRSETGQPEFLPKQKNTWLYTLDSGIKIGVIGLTTKETPTTSGSFTDGSFPAYQFQDYLQVVIDGSQQLRADGANAVLIVSHVGNDCNADSTFGIWQQNSPQISTCKQTDEISTLLSQLPTGTIDGVVQGHRHKFSHHFINGVPVMGTINGGYYFNILYLSFYNKQVYGKVIQGPVPVCQKVFSNLNKCNYLSSSQLVSAGELVQWQFHGVKVTKHLGVKQLFQTKWLPKMADYLEPLAFNQLTLQKTYLRQNLLGNLVTDLVHAACPGYDFVILNEGGFRAVWYPGVVQYRHFYSMFPFVNEIVSFEITGSQLVSSLAVLQSGKKAYYPTKNFKQRVKIYSNGTRQLTNVTFYDGTPIQQNKTYVGLTLGFLLLGGDDFQNVMGKTYTLRGNKSLGEFRGLVKPALIKYGTITESRIFDPLNPRIIIDSL